MRLPTSFPSISLILGLTLAATVAAQAAKSPEKAPETQATELLIRASEAATAGGSGCDVAFLQEYIELVSGHLPESASSIFAQSLGKLKEGPEKACLRESLKSLGLGITSS